MSNKLKEEEEVLMTLLPDKSNCDTVLSMDEDEEPPDTSTRTNQYKNTKTQKARISNVQRHQKPSKKTGLHLAAEVGDTERLKELISTNPKDTSSQDESCRTPLHLAAKGIHHQCCQILLEASSKELNMKDKNGESPLMLSISSGNISFNTTKLLLSYGAKVTIENKGKWTALHIAAERGNSETLRLLLENDKSSIENADSEKQTSLHLAARYGHSQACTILLLAEANKEARDKSGCTPLHWAAKMGFLQCIKTLISSGSEVNCTDLGGNTPLHLLCASGKDKPECLKELLDNGADFDAQNNKGETAFHLAQYSSYEVRKVFQTLPLNLNLIDKKGRTVLHCASERSKTSVRIDLILSMDQLRTMEVENFVNMKDGKGNTALHLAIMNGEISTCRSLVKAGADGNIVCNGRGTALHLAAEKGFDEICAFLIAKKVKVNVRNNQSLTPLHLAAKNGHNKCCDLLLRRGALVADPDADGNTVLHHAAQGNHPACCELLINSKALSNKFNNEGKTPLHIAVENGSQDCCKMLVTEKTDIWASESSIKSPVKLAYDLNQKNIFIYLLSHCSLNHANHSKQDIDFREFMEKALQTSDSEAITSIINSCYWEECLQPYDKPEDNKAKPKKNENMRLLVEKYPALAEEVFDKCLPCENEETVEESKASPTRRHTMFYIDEMSINPDDGDIPNARNKSALKYEAYFDPNCGQLKRGLKAFHTNQIWRRNHVLSCAIRHRHYNLLTHPLVLNWIKYKWYCYIRWIQYFFVLLALAVASLLTIFSIDAWSWPAFQETWSINQSSVCSPGKQLVGPEVYPYLAKESEVASKISYAIYGILGVWILHDLYKLAMLRLRYFSKETRALWVTVASSIIFLGNFTACSRQTYIREDWQWIAGYIAICSSWILVVYLFNTHPTRQPIFEFRRLIATAAKVFTPEIPILIVILAIYVMIPNGNVALKHFLDVLKHIYGNTSSFVALIVILLLSMVMLRMFTTKKSGLHQKINEECIVTSINIILDYDLVYPCFRRAFYRAWLTLDEEQRVTGCLSFLKCCRMKEHSSKTDGIKKYGPLLHGNKDKIESLLTNIQADLNEIKTQLANQ